MEDNVSRPNFGGKERWVVYDEDGNIDQAATDEKRAALRESMARHPSQEGARPGHIITSAEVGGRVVRLEVVDSSEPDLN